MIWMDFHLNRTFVHYGCCLESFTKFYRAHTLWCMMSNCGLLNHHFWIANTLKRSYYLFFEKKEKCEITSNDHTKSFKWYDGGNRGGSGCGQGCLRNDFSVLTATTKITIQFAFVPQYDLITLQWNDDFLSVYQCIIMNTQWSNSAPSIFVFAVCLLSLTELHSFWMVYFLFFLFVWIYISFMTVWKIAILCVCVFCVCKWIEELIWSFLHYVDSTNSFLSATRMTLNQAHAHI